MAAAASIGAGAPPGVRWRRGRGEGREGKGLGFLWLPLACPREGGGEGRARVQ